MKNNKDKGRVSTEWVLNNHNLDDYRNTKYITEYTGDLVTELKLKNNEAVDLNDYLAERFNNVFLNVKKLRLNGGKIQLGYQKVSRESDEEVIQRLKDKEITKRKAQALLNKEYKEYLRLKRIFGDVDDVFNGRSVPAYEVK